MSVADSITLSAVFTRPLPSIGINVMALLREVGLPTSLLNGERARVDTARFFALWRAMEHLNPDPALGLRLVAEASPEQFDAAWLVAGHAENLGDALGRMARYKRLVSPEEMTVRHVGEEVCVEFHWVQSLETPPASLVDARLASVLSLARNATGEPIRPLRVEFARPQSHRALFERHFECEVVFDAPVSRIVLPASALELPFRASDPDLLAVLAPGLQAAPPVRKAARLGPAFVDGVKAAIRMHMQGRRPKVEAVAKDFMLGGRSLQRKLGESGTTYQRLLDEVREEIACELLANTDLDHGEIAFLLGFEELNSFNRAFSIWKGTTPLRWRSGRRSAGVLPRESAVLQDTVSRISDNAVSPEPASDASSNPLRPPSLAR